MSLSLKEYCFRYGIKHNAFAKMIGKTPTYISSMINRHRRPSVSLALEIEKLTDGKVTAHYLLLGDQKEEVKKPSENLTWQE